MFVKSLEHSVTGVSHFARVIIIIMIIMIFVMKIIVPEENIEVKNRLVATSDI